MNRDLIDKQVELAQQRLGEVELKMAEPDVVTDRKAMEELGREHRRLKELVTTAAKLKELEEQISGARELAASDDEEMAELAAAEVEELEPEVKRAENALFISLVPPEASDNKTAIVEIRAGTGGEEAALFAGDLHRMYTRLCERRGWRIELISVSASDMGGYKEIVFSVKETPPLAT